MHDIGPIVWVVLVIVGVVSSIASNARKQAAQAQMQTARPAARIPQAQAGPAARPQVASAGLPDTGLPRTAPKRAAAPPRRTAAPPLQLPAEPFPSHERPSQRRVPLSHLFGDRGSIVRSVIAAEVLGKPRALRDEE